MDGEPIDLLTEFGRRLVYRWEHPGAGPWDVTYAYVGQLADGRWYADRTKLGPRDARAFPTERAALDAAGRLMADRPTGWTAVEPHPPLSPGQHRGDGGSERSNREHDGEGG